MKKESQKPFFAFFSREFCFSNVYLFNHKQAGPLGFRHRGVCSQDYCPGVPSEEKSLLLDWTCLVSANHKSRVISYSVSTEGYLLCICKTCCVLKSRISLKSSFKTVRIQKRLRKRGLKEGNSIVIYSEMRNYWSNATPVLACLPENLFYKASWSWSIKYLKMSRKTELVALQEKIPCVLGWVNLCE